MPPISPKPVTDYGPDYLPAYVSNGLIGLRVREIPLMAGVATVSGLSGIDPTTQIMSSPYVPYPLAGDIRLGAVQMSDSPSNVRFIGQTYDFTCGELTTRFEFTMEGVVARVEVLTFCSRTLPSLALQEVIVEVSKPVDVTLTALVDQRNVAGHWEHRWTSVPGQETDLVDGTLAWTTFGEVATAGISYATEFSGDSNATCTKIAEEQAPLGTHYAFRARSNRRYRLRQFAGIVPNVLHHQPEAEAIRLVAEGRLLGFDELRRENREAWADIWRSRILIHGADERWQGLADAGYFYLMSSVHPSSPSSVHIFGLARWPNYHYYYGHVMWDVETFVLPTLLLLQPDAARAILEYRTRSLDSARRNARLRGQMGVLFPWESDPERGEEATIGTAKGASTEEHVNMAVALGFARYAHVTGDDWFLREQAWPVLRGVAEWIASRVERSDRGYAIRRTKGIAERIQVENNNAYVNMAASMALREAVSAARRLGLDAPDHWQDIAECLVIPTDEKRGVVLDHDDFDSAEEKGATPGPLAGFFPIGYPVDERVQRATTDFYLRQSDEYIGSPMLSALYGAWAARVGDRDAALRLFEEGYAAFVSERFMNTHEYREDRFPEQPIAGPFFANIGGFLMSLLYGLTGIRISPDAPDTWPERPVCLPTGWQAIEVERLWARGRPMRLVARHGDSHASLTPTQ
jgi:hypothetical protein